MTITCNLYINGQWHDAEGRRTFTRRHPAHDEAASVAAAASPPTANAQASKPRPALKRRTKNEGFIPTVTRHGRR